MFHQQNGLPQSMSNWYPSLKFGLRVDTTKIFQTATNCPTRIDMILHCPQLYPGIHFTLSLRSLFTNRELVVEGLIVEKFEREPLRTSVLNLLSQIDPAWKNNNHISLIQHNLFQVNRSFTSSPPKDFFLVTTSHETLAEWCSSNIPFHRNRPQREFILFTQALGNRKIEHQKFAILAMTVLIKNSLPAKDNVLTL